ncbi:MAG: hypothetical protein H7Y43_06470, partial [Akkermansiaceae bacterium]|nr:hypothetical protein [Verrucomicrobiales bacterium]
SVPATNSPLAFRIYRADQPSGPFSHLLTLSADTRTFTDTDLNDGCQYLYEVAAVYPTNVTRSAPFAILSSASSNLVANSGFEDNNDSHWDKWFTGDIDWTNMVTSTNVFYQGRKSMEICLNSNANNGSISQFGQYGVPNSSMPTTPGQLYSFGGFFKSGGLTQPTTHWIEWSSTQTGLNPNARPSRPYPGYFTPHFSPGTAATPWTYANRVLVLPAGFPNVELTHWFTAVAPASGSIHLDNFFFRALPTPSATNWTDLIPLRSSWRYTLLPPGGNWFAKNFNDSNWSVGQAKFGTGGGPTGIATPLVPYLPAYYFRRTFVLPFAPCEELLLAATCTDAGLPLEIYLNGTRLATTGIEATTSHGNEIQYFDLAPFLDLLQPGVNTIAVMLNNSAGLDWDDVAFDVSLKTIVKSTSRTSLSIGSISAEPGAAASVSGPMQIGLNLSAPPDSLWRVESANQITGPWQLVEVITNSSTGTLTLQDYGQNGRTPPSSSGSRFYRLIPN